MKFLNLFEYKKLENRVNEVVYYRVKFIGNVAAEWDHGEDIEVSLDLKTGVLTAYEFIDDTQVYNHFIIKNVYSSV